MQANQNTPDPRQSQAWEIYILRLSETGEKNAYKAALEAGYSDKYSQNITLQDWWGERESRLMRRGLLTKSEKKLAQALDFNPVIDEAKNLINVGLLKVQTEVAKYVTSTQGKNEGYSTRTELTGADGKDLPAPILGGITQNDLPADDGSQKNPSA
jgi:hypothetical protein